MKRMPLLLAFLLSGLFVVTAQAAAPVGETITLYSTGKAAYVNTNPKGDHLISADGLAAFGYYTRI